MLAAYAMIQCVKLPHLLRPFRERTESDVIVSVMRPRTIWLGAVTVVIFGVLSGWFLLSNFGGGTSQDRVRLEILKLTGSVVVGTGGGVALLLAARRQRATELDIVQKKQAAEETQHDAVERRVTELYTAAAEQLGSDKAAVRLAGLYALERLAEGYPDHRRTIVEVICAYLRMPFDPPPPKKAFPGVQAPVLPRTRQGLKSPSRQNTNVSSPTRTIIEAASKLNDSLCTAGDQSQELQVRLAAQNLLIRHSKRWSDRFWPEMRMDLAGAVLVDWCMLDCVVSIADFSNAVFFGTTMFDRTVFDVGARFGGADFTTGVRFDSAKFHISAQFDQAKFRSRAHFDNIETHTFPADFFWAKFEGFASFSGAVFASESDWKESVEFRGTVFCSGFNFEDIEGPDAIDFDGAKAKYVSDFVPPRGWQCKPLVETYNSSQKWMSFEIEESPD